MSELKDKQDYLEWIVDIVTPDISKRNNQYNKLFEHLYGTYFRYSIPKDANRAADGIDLRYRYSNEYGILYFDEPCTVLEMIVALAIRCEESIMDDPDYGNRTSQWFWGMINSLGVASMTDENYNEQYVTECIDRFLDRKYAPNGRGGLFTVRHCDCDLRDVEIWYQMSYYLRAFI